MEGRIAKWCEKAGSEVTYEFVIVRAFDYLQIRRHQQPLAEKRDSKHDVDQRRRQSLVGGVLVDTRRTVRDERRLVCAPQKLFCSFLAAAKCQLKYFWAQPTRVFRVRFVLASTVKMIVVAHFFL